MLLLNLSSHAIQQGLPKTTFEQSQLGTMAIPLVTARTRAVDGAEYTSTEPPQREVCRTPTTFRARFFDVRQTGRDRRFCPVEAANEVGSIDATRADGTSRSNAYRS